MKRKHSNENQSKKKTIWRWIAGIVILLSAIAGIVFGYYSHTLNQFFDSIQGDEQTETAEEEEITSMLTNKQPISVLLLGVDERPNDPGRSDTIIVGTFNPSEQTTHLLSIPRDTLITLPGTEDQLDKINATYTYGGISQVTQAVEELLEIPIHFYGQLNFQGFVDLVDAVNGITVDAPFDFTVTGYQSGEIQIEEGVQHLNGEEALGYARMRKQDPRGDFGRQDRQREVIQNLLDKLISFSSLTRMNEILEAIQPNLRTNVTINQALSIAGNYASALDNVEETTIPGAADYLYIPAYNQEVYIWRPNEEGLQEIQSTLQRHLGLTHPYDPPVEPEPIKP